MLGSNLALLKTSESCACFLSAHPSGPGGNPKGIKGVDVRWCKTTGFGTSQFNTIYCYFNGKNGNRNETDIFNHQILWCIILRQTQCISRQTQTNPTHPTNSWHLTSGLLTTFFILRPERVGIHHCLWTKNENSQFRLCFCPHTQAAQIDIKSSCLFLVISVTSSYSLFYPGSLSTSSGPSIWPFLPVASHYMASFVSEAIHPTTGAALTAQGSLRTAETRSPASFPKQHFCPARPRHNGSSWCSGAGQGWGGASFVQVVLHISMIHRTDRTVFQLKKTSSLPKDPICWWIVPVCWWIVSRWIPSATAGGKRFEPCVGSPARPSWNACRGPWLVLKLLWEVSSVSSWKKY